VPKIRKRKKNNTAGPPANITGDARAAILSRRPRESSRFIMSFGVCKSLISPDLL
jgi:hypothetical protein